ncbi:MAG: hypothetical protein HRT69_01105 [Flavobacteriaceae bacterium]|nr:hypothetical protein [Flavobacteriaceae bacterium]
MKNFFQGYRSRFIYNTIFLNFDRTDIWNEITNVTVTQFKFPFLFSIIGVPKPLSAEVIRKGVGGYRVASFSNDAQFKQEILEWVENKKYRFKFNPTDNFRVGYLMNLSNGPFEIKTGGYELIKGKNEVKLILSSNYKLNGFLGVIAHLPFRLVVYFFQKHLLNGIRKNLELHKD